MLTQFLRRRPVSKNLNATFEQQITFGQRLADQVATFGGSWTFIMLFGVVLVLWIWANAQSARPWDPYPFILLNLVLSCLAALQAPVIMMSQNRQAAKDRLDAQNDYEVNLKAEMEVLALHSKLDEVREREGQELVELQQRHQALMNRLERLLEDPRGRARARALTRPGAAMTPSYNLVVTGGTLVTRRGTTPGTVAVRDGRVAAVLPPAPRPPPATRWTPPACTSCPASWTRTSTRAIPASPPARTSSRAPRRPPPAASRPCSRCRISKVPTNSAAAVERRVSAMQPGALIDFGLYGGAGDENLDDVAGQAEAGVVAFKTFLQPPPPARLDEFRGLWSLDPAARRDVVRAVAATGLPHAFHCEQAPLYLALQQRLEAAGRTDGLAHAESRPPIVEETSVAEVLALAAEAGAHAHVVHLSSPRSADLVRDARARGVRVTAETCLPYLFLTEQALAVHAGFAKCNPPLRSAADVEALWRKLGEGLIDVIGTDHSPFLEEEKARGAESIFQAPPGLAGLELLVPLMLTAASQGRLTLADVARLLSERAAALFRLPGKGRIEPGADADLTLVDTRAEWTFDHRAARTRARANMRVFDGLRLCGRVVATVVRGVPVFRDGEITGRPGHGRFLRPDAGLRRAGALG